MQHDKPLGYFSRKLTDTQRRYPVTEQELLAIMETLKFFHHMLFGHKIIIKTDHKNLTHQVSSHASDRVLRQHLLLEEYGVELENIKGENNTVADALSRIPTEELFIFDESVEFPLNMALIADKQLTDPHLQKALLEQSNLYSAAEREGQQIYVNRQTDSVYVPASLRPAVLEWYHTTLLHPGTKRMQATVKENFYWPGLDASVEALVRTCEIFQKCKITAVKKIWKDSLASALTLTTMGGSSRGSHWPLGR
jgi:hypothetical protein